jgi:hypothetical protein
MTINRESASESIPASTKPIPNEMAIALLCATAASRVPRRKDLLLLPVSLPIPSFKPPLISCLKKRALSWAP